MKRLLIILLGGWLLLATLPTRAQRFAETKVRNPWNLGSNAAGLRADTLSLSYAALWAGRQQGGLIDHSQSDRSHTAGIGTESIRHFKRISFAGGFHYGYFDGQNLCGSISTRPGYWPVDIYEYTPGRKTREEYGVRGALSADLSPHWRIGLGADFLAGNYAKRKDLRHKNTTLDLEVMPSVMGHWGAWAVGLAYRFEKHSERIEAEEIGSTPESYRAFFDKGLYYGVENLWTSNEIHLDEAGVSALPIQKMIHGAALQVQYNNLFLEADYRHTAGNTGEKGVEWHNFQGDQLLGRLVWDLYRGESRHRLWGSIRWEQSNNRELILTKQTVGGVTNTEILGEIPIFEERTLESALHYEWHYRGSYLKAGADYQLVRRQSSLLHPLLREQAMRRWGVDVEGLWALNKVEILASLFASWGSHAEWERCEGTLQPESGYPMQQEQLFRWHNEYLTATRLGAELGVRITLFRGLYADLKARYEHGFGLQYTPQPNRLETLLGLGFRW